MAATGKQVSAILKPNQYWAAPRPHLPCFSVEEQWAAIALYRELAKGEPVDDTRLAWTLGLSITETRAFLERETIKCLVYTRVGSLASPALRRTSGAWAPIQLFAQEGRYCGVYFDAPVVVVVVVVVVVTLDGTPAFGMAFELRGKDLRIRQLHGMRGISFRGRYHALRPWPRLLVQACQDLAIACGYKRVMVIRSHRSYSWPRPSHRKDGPSTPEGIREDLELRLRLIKRLDETAKSIDGFEIGTQWWIWQNPLTKNTARR